MNVLDVLKYGQRTLLGTLEGFPQSALDTPGACGVWSVKDIIAHLASYEYLLVEALLPFVGGGPTPHLDEMAKLGGQGYNDVEVGARKSRSMAEVLDEQIRTQARTMELAAKVSPEVLRQAGAIPWYGMQYSLDDYVAYAFYGHKREHSAQIAAFCDVLDRETPLPGSLSAGQALDTAERVKQALNHHDLDGLMALFSEDCVFENTYPAPDGQRFEGQAAVRAFFGDFLQANRVVDFQTEEAFAGDGRCAVRWVFHWENVRGEQGSVRGMDLFHLRDGKVSENYSYVKG